jgi:hypothetical protein
LSIDVSNAAEDHLQMALNKIYKGVATYLFISVTGSFAPSVMAIDTVTEELTCQSIGFKKKTEGFASCVLELLDRRSTQTSAVYVEVNSDDSTCRKYGFKPKTNEYASCRMQIDQARKDFQIQESQFAEKQRQYQAQLVQQQKQRNIDSGIALMQMGAGISSGAYNSKNAYGALPSPPLPPQNLSRTYMLPGGKMMNCTTTGSVTNCF